MKAKLHPYQELAKRFVLTRPRSGLFMECGTGKTLVTLSALEDLKLPHHTLVIAPKLVAMTSWTEEIAKWNIQLNPVVIAGLERADRHKLYNEIPNYPPSVFFINQENVVDLVQNTDRWYFRTVIVDEMHKFKSATSKRFQALQAVSPYVERLIGLTGTPQPNGLMDLWAEVFLLDHGYRLGATISQYREWFFVPDEHSIMYNRVTNWLPKYGADQEIHRRLQGLVLSIKNTPLNLPSINYVDHVIPLDKKEKNLYNKFVKEKVLAFNDNDKNVPVEDQEAVAFIPATNAGVKTLKLWQMSSGALYKPLDIREQKADFYQIHTKKLDYLESLLETVDGNVIVFYNFQSDLVLLEQRLKDLGYAPYDESLSNDQQNYAVFDKSVRIKNAFAEKKINVLLMQPKAGGIGINIQTGGHTAIWYTIPIQLDDYIQANTRLHRQGQTHPVFIHHLIIKDTIDEHFRRKLTAKEESQKALMDATDKFLDNPIIP